MSEFDRIEIKFQGRDADLGRLHFYEHSRSQYALARFVSTIEIFRRNNRVAERISSGNYVDILIETPKRGSFLTELIVPIFTGAGGNLLSIPFSHLFSYVWDAIATKPTEHRLPEDTIKELAKLLYKDIEREEKKDQQTKEIIEDLSLTIRGEQNNTKAALNILEFAFNSQNRIINDILSKTPKIDEIRSQLTYDAERESLLSANEDEFSQIDKEELRRLTSRLRPMVPEIGLPLRRSATSLSISDPSSKGKIIRLDDYRIAEIEKRTISDQEITIECTIRMYDKFSGTGKVHSEHLLRDLNFRVPPNTRKELLPLILDAMARNTVTCRFDVIQDESKLDGSKNMAEFAVF